MVSDVRQPPDTLSVTQFEKSSVQEEIVVNDDVPLPPEHESPTGVDGILLATEIEDGGAARSLPRHGAHPGADQVGEALDPSARTTLTWRHMAVPAGRSTV